MYNFFLENFILPFGDFVLGTKYLETLKQYRMFQTLTNSELNNLHSERLSKILNHAVKRIRFYNNIQLSDGLDPLSDLKKFPIMYKNTIKENINDLIDGSKKGLLFEKSSGSSGIQGGVYTSKDEISITQGIQTLWWEWAGYKIGNSLLQTGITPKRGLIKSIKDKFFKTEYVPAFGLSDDFIINKLHNLELKPKNHFAGYASSLYLFAKIAEKYNINNVHFDSVFSWGDKMFPHYRKLIEKQFSTKVFDTYGCTEGFVIAAQKDSEDYYIMTPHVHLEIIDKYGNEVNDGELGYVVVTRLDAFHMPLIRYYLGDLAIKSKANSVNFELQFPRLEKIIGRDTDIVRTKSGKYMIVHFFTGIFEHIPEIKQFRVIQNDLDSIVIEIIPGNNFNDEVLKMVHSKIEDYLNESFIVNFKLVESIPDTPSGKPQLIQSTLPKFE